MIKKIDPAQLRQDPLWAIGGLGMLLLIAFLVMASRVEAARQEFYATQEMLKFYRMEVWHLEKLDRDKLEKQLAGKLVRFPSANELTPLIDEITETAKGYGVQFESIAPKEMIADSAANDPVASLLNRVPLEMHAHGSYENLAAFLGHLSELEHGLVRVDHFDLNPKDANSEVLNLSLAGTAYVKKPPEEKILERDLLIQTATGESRGKGRFGDMTRNPFGKAPENERAQLNLEGIIFDPRMPLAVINGEVKRVGDTAGDMVIVEIRQNGVTLEARDKKSRLQLKPGARKN